MFKLISTKWDISKPRASSSCSADWLLLPHVSDISSFILKLLTRAGGLADQLWLNMESYFNLLITCNLFQ